MTNDPNNPAGTPSTTNPAGNVLQVTGNLDPTHSETELWMMDGRVLRLPTSLLVGSRSGFADEETTRQALAEPDTIVVPIVEEKLSVDKRVIETGKLRLHKTVQEYLHALDEPLAIRTFDIERVVLNQPVETAPPTRTEGDTTIYPVVEEQLILTKQLVLKEEIRVTRRDTERRDTQVVTLRREHIEVERTGPAS